MKKNEKDSTLYYLSEQNLKQWLSGEGFGKVFILGEKSIENKADFNQLSSLLYSARTTTPAKSFFLPLLEQVATYSIDNSNKKQTIEEARRTIINVRGCDLRAIALIDELMLKQDPPDPFYQKYREKTIIISSDCVVADDCCFCSVLGDNPYPEKGYDINLSPLNGGYIVVSGTERGEELISNHQSLFTEVDNEQQTLVSNNRQQLSKQLSEKYVKEGVKLATPEHFEKDVNDPKWIKLGIGCVECGGCTNICPTCYCFYLFDQTVDGQNNTVERIRTWDSCMESDYSRMAGVGGMKPNPRASFVSRFANRFLHKFKNQPPVYNRPGCTGCGRCIQVCPGKIDIREVLAEIVK